MINEKLLPQVEDFSSKITYESGESAVGYSFKKQGDLVVIMYQGQAKTHSNGAILFTLPSGYRPTNNEYYGTFIKLAGGTNNVATGNIQIVNSNGQVKVNGISSTSLSGRIYFQMSYFIK